MKTLKLSLLGIFAFITPVLFYIQAVKLADEKTKQNTSDTINIRARYEQQLSIERLKYSYSDSLKSKEIEYLNRLIALNRDAKPATPKINLSNIESSLDNIESTLNGIRTNTSNTNNSISDVQAYLEETNEYLFQIDSLINEKTFQLSNQADNSNNSFKDSIIIRSVQNEMNLEIYRLLKIRDDILLLQSNLRKRVLRRLLNQKDSAKYFGLKNIDSFQNLIINRPYKLYFEQNKQDTSKQQIDTPKSKIVRRKPKLSKLGNFKLKGG